MNERNIADAKRIYENSNREISQAKIGVAATLGIGRGVVDMITQYIPNVGRVVISLAADGVKEGLKQASDTAFGKFQQKKRLEFLEAVSSYDHVLSEEDIEKINETDFIIEFEKSLEVIDRQARDKKVHFIANLFGKYFINECHEDVDQFEEYLNLISRLTDREIEILIEFYKIETKHKEENTSEQEQKGEKSSVPFCEVCMNELKEVVAAKWGIGEEEMEGLLFALCGSGFLKEKVGAYLGYAGGAFYTTEYFEKFLKYIID